MGVKFGLSHRGKNIRVCEGRELRKILGGQVGALKRKLEEIA